MADTAQLLAEAAALLTERGVPVERYPGWRTRGKNRLRPQTHVEHDTADPAPLTRRRMLDLLANGHGSLRNALCTWAVPRERPTAVLIAARTAWHAGRGSWDGVTGNSRATGTEIQRAQGQRITTEQWDIAAEITRVEIEVFGPLEVVRVCTHNEWTPRKTDPQGLSGSAWRDRLARTPDPEPEPDPEDDDMKMELWTGPDPQTPDDDSHHVWLVQRDMAAPGNHLGYYSKLTPAEAKHYRDLASRRADFIEAEAKAARSWFTDARLSRK